MDYLDGVVSGPRPGRMRDRRGRGRRGPVALPGPLSPRGVPLDVSPRADFDAVVGEILKTLAPRFAAESEPVDVVVEEVPILPVDWAEDLPLASVVRGGGAEPTKVALFRLPLTQRAVDRADLVDLLWTVIVDKLAEVWLVPPDDLDPRD